MKSLKLSSTLLILASLACGQFLPATTIPSVAVPSITAQSAATEVDATLEAAQPAEIVYGATARGHIAAITEQIGARWTGTEQEAQTAQYIQDTFAQIGYEPVIQPFSRSGWVDDETESIFKSANVIAVKGGESDQVIVIGAHYDSSDEGLGADDNASGVGILLELAEQLKDISTPYTIHFIAFGGEEAGLLGSQEYVDTLSADEISNTVGMINLDSLIAGDITYVYCSESKSALRDWVLSWAKLNEIALQTIPNVELSEDGYGISDYDAFDKAGIPFAYFESTNWTLGNKDGYTQVGPQYGDGGAVFHTEYDTLAYLDETFPNRVDEHLNDVIAILYNLLTQYNANN
ncbi:MAG: M20/M25/M40 family metallo-hydrolase [Chloroflexi bacterium]|nr:M20/M25/M40 family metallo-hydrolase [Chloroflexota bacterium]